MRIKFDVFKQCHGRMLTKSDRITVYTCKCDLFPVLAAVANACDLTGTYYEGGVDVCSAGHDVSVGVDFFHCLIMVQIMERIIEALGAEFY